MLDQIVAKHYTNYENQSVENIKQDAKGLLHIISDYEGRVVFELLQNAFDRAEDKITIIIKNDFLYVANDGKKFTYIKDYDYEKGQNEHRGDFQSICSVYTSTKTVSNAIGNKGIGFKSVFSIAKNQEQNINKFPTRYVEIFTKGLFIEKKTQSQEAECGFRLFEMIRSGDWLIPVAHKVDIAEISEKIKNAQQEYADTGLPGYYFPMEVSTRQDTIQQLFAENYVTIISIPLQDKENTKKQILQNLINNGIHFQFVQLKYPKSFNIDISLDEEDSISKVVHQKNSNLIYQKVDNQELKDLALKAGIEIETVSIGVYLRNDNKGKLYNYLPTDVKSPFPFVDFHADFRTTLNREHINWQEAVGDYNKALLRACIELLFSIWKPNAIILNLKYIIGFQKFEVPKWDIKYFEPAFDVESIETKIVISLFFIKDGRWDLDFKNFTNYLAYNIKRSAQNYKNKDYQKLYDVIVKFCFAITSDYKLSAWSRIDGFMENLKSSFEEIKVNILPKLKLENKREIFYNKEETVASSILPVYFTTINFENEKLRKILNVKNYSEINEVFKHFKQCNYSENVLDEKLSITEEYQIEILKFVYDLFLRKNDQEIQFSDRYTTVLTGLLREKNPTKNQAKFNLATLFLKTKNGKYKPAQLCTLHEIDDDFRKKLDFSNNFYYYLGVSPDTHVKVFDIRIFNKFKDGLSFIPKHVNFDGIKDPINKDIVLNCRISHDQTNIHPALINDNYSKLFPDFKKAHYKSIKSVAQILKVKKYDEFPVEYFSKLLDHITQYFNSDLLFPYIQNFYAYSFHLFHSNNIWLVYNGKRIEVTTQKSFTILKTKVDLDTAYQQQLKNFLIYEADRGLNEDKELENRILKIKETVSFDKATKLDITGKVNEILSGKLVYILYDISKDKHSDRDYLENDYSILDIVKNTKFYVVTNFKIHRTSEFLSYDYSDKFKIELNDIYMADESDKTVSLIISTWLFGTDRYAEKIEIILYHRNSIELMIEYDSNEIKLFKQKYDVSYLIKDGLFLKEINKNFPEIMLHDPKWNYEGSSSLLEIDKKGRREELIAFIDDLKFSDDFKEFDFDYNLVSLNNTIVNFEDATEKKEFVKDSEVDYLIRKLSNHLSDKYFNSNIENDYSTVIPSKNILKKKKIVNNQDEKIANNNLEVIGSNGEHEVLQYYVYNFLGLSPEEKKDIVIKVYNLIKNIVQDVYYYETLKEKILLNVNADDVIESLIPLFYITSKYKYSYFDMIGFNDGKVFPVEVKTTSSTSSLDFFISRAEVDCALQFNDYQIVRVTPDEIRFLGNPIRSFRDQLQGFQNNSYKLISTKYKIQLLK